MVNVTCVLGYLVGGAHPQRSARTLKPGRGGSHLLEPRELYAGEAAAAIAPKEGKTAERARGLEGRKGGGKRRRRGGVRGGVGGEGYLLHEDIPGGDERGLQRPDEHVAEGGVVHEAKDWVLRDEHAVHVAKRAARHAHARTHTHTQRGEGRRGEGSQEREG